MKQSAATPWKKYVKIPMSPDIGEWCLWSAKINGNRNLFSGHLFEYRGRLGLHWDGGASYWLDELDSVFWARVHFLERYELDNIVKDRQ